MVEDIETKENKARVSLTERKGIFCEKKKIKENGNDRREEKRREGREEKRREERRREEKRREEKRR